jgi:hypothetical protein
MPERKGLEFIVERAQEEIRRRRMMIRDHCADSGLPAPLEDFE